MFSSPQEPSQVPLAAEEEESKPIFEEQTSFLNPRTVRKEKASDWEFPGANSCSDRCRAQPCFCAGWGQTTHLSHAADHDEGKDDGFSLGFLGARPALLDRCVSSTWFAVAGEWQSTAISGNDVTSSCLYVTGLCLVDVGALRA
jgi:hypothetical protein